MELPYAKQREKYIELVKELEQELKTTTTNSADSDLDLHVIQQKLDTLAHKYQEDEKIGTARYKLYELQAFIYYFEHQDDKAYDFISHAIKLRGNSYPKAEKLKEKLTTEASSQPNSPIDESKMTIAEKRKKFIGLEGWLALFIVGQFLALLLTIIRIFFDGSTSSSDINALNTYQAGLGDALQNLTMFENIAIFIYIALVVTTLVLLFRRRKAAKAFAIISLTFAAIYGMVDYAIAYSLFQSSGLTQDASLQSFLSQYSSDVGRNVVAALIWVPYFLASKRVKATLTK